jgi:uncharacterized protein (TIGR02453 family)
VSAFGGFPAETFAFLEGIAAHNEKAWFDANRPLYEAGYVEPAKALVAELGPRLREISPGVQFDPKVNGSIARINRDIRFSKDKRPYKDHLDLWFWHGDKRGWDQPGFWFRLTPTRVHLGSGMHGFDKELLERFRQSIVHPRSGKALLAAVKQVKARGYEVGGKTRKQLPRGFDTDPDRAEYLLFEGLHAGTEMPAAAAREAGFVEMALRHFTDTWPIGKWLVDEVSP